MEEKNDDDVVRFFIRILNSIVYIFLWIMASATVGIYWGFGYNHGQPVIYIVLFYFFMAVSLALLTRYLYRKWKK